MTNVYRKLKVTKEATQAERDDFLQAEVCDIVNQLLENNPDNLETWPLYGYVVLPGQDRKTLYEEKEGDKALEEEDKGNTPPDDNKQGDNKSEDEPEPVNGEVIDEQPISQRRTWLILISLLTCVVLLYIASRFAIPGTSPRLTITSTLSSDIQGEGNQRPSETSESSVTSLSPTSAPSATTPPTVSPTSGVPPTAVPLPIKEDFSKNYSDLWTVIGNPLVTEKGPLGYYSGVLTAKLYDPSSMFIGNTAWSDYVISIRAYDVVIIGYELTIGIRVKDRNNMIALECTSPGCSWSVIDEGKHETLLTNQDAWMSKNFTLTVRGDTFLGVGDPPSSSIEPSTTSLILPPKYEGKFQGGGIYLRFQNTEIDYIQIDPLP
jgi:hypothetical protein